MATVKVLFLIFYLMVFCETYKILVTFPLKIRSHGNLGDGVVRNLLKDGHEVTFITPYLHKEHPNLRQIDIRADVDVLPNFADNVRSRLKNSIHYDSQLPFIQFCSNLTTLLLNNKGVQELINNVNEKFDLVIVDWTYTEVLAGLATLFDCPLIWVSPLEINWAVLNLIDEPTNPAYTTDIISNSIFPFTFRERAIELWVRIKTEYYKIMYTNKLQNSIYNNMLVPAIRKRGKDPPTFYEVQFNASLVLANSHVSIGPSIAIPQNYKPIAGYYIEENVSPLPENLQKLMDNSKHGVIYFSLGSNMNSTAIPDNLKRDLINMFGTLKQNVIWKYEDNLDGVPENVYILNWAPQNSILSHPKCFLFITHGGLLSTTEAVHFAVPIIGIPSYLDQFANVNTIVSKGIGKRVDFTVNVASDLKIAIEEVLRNKSYTEKVKELSYIYHDRPIKPADEMIHWVKHVVKTRGALHLRSPAFVTPFYQKLYLDLLALVIAVLGTLFMLFKIIVGKIKSKTKSDDAKKRQ